MIKRSSDKNMFLLANKDYNKCHEKKNVANNISKKMCLAKCQAFVQRLETVI